MAIRRIKAHTASEEGQYIRIEKQSMRVLGLVLGACIGAATYPCCAKDSKGLKSKADELMYEVKRSGKNSYRIATSTA